MKKAMIIMWVLAGVFTLCTVLTDFNSVMCVNAIICLIIAGILTICKRRKKYKKEEGSKRDYSVQGEARTGNIYFKKPIMTENEINWYNAIQENVPAGYFLFPQVNLATIIAKGSNSRYVNELFRNVDFGIFNDCGQIIVLIEINDNSHKEKSRMARDYKVKAICESAEIPLITFWTEYGINKEYIKKRVQQYI